jgi:fructosamine-3-kinase
MDERVRETLARVTGRTPVTATPLHGGCVSEVMRIDFEHGEPVVAKTGDVACGLLLEAERLRYLAARTSLPLPEVLHADETLLVLSFIANDGRIDDRCESHAAELLAALHGVRGEAYGFVADTLTVGLRKPAPWTATWLEFFRDHRLLYMADEANAAGRLPGALLVRVERLAARLSEWVEDPAPPSLLHGDVWHGNVLTRKGRVVGFVDPSCYYADPEIELAYTTLFGTFGAPFFRRYHEIRPLRPGFFEGRRDLYNLYPLLTHVRLFGGPYVDAAAQVLDRLGA